MQLTALRLRCARIQLFRGMIALFFVPASQAAPQQEPVSFHLSSDIVVDPSKACVFAVATDEHIAAIDLENGSDIWKSNQRSTPLGLANGFLVTLGKDRSDNALDVSFVRSFDGLVSRKATVSLPSTSQSSSTAVDLQFPSGISHPTVVWEVTARPRGGARPGSGDAYLGRNAGVRQSITPRAGMGSPAANQAKVSGGLVKQYGATSFDIVSGESTKLPDEEASAMWTTTVESNKPANSTHIPSSDGGSYLVSKKFGSPSTDASYQWSIYSAKNNQLLGRIKANASSYPFFVTDKDLLVYDMPGSEIRQSDGHITRVGRTLQAIDLKTGQQVWSHEISGRDRTWAVPP